MFETFLALLKHRPLFRFFISKSAKENLKETIENEKSTIERESLECSFRIFEKINDCRIALRLRDEELELERGEHRLDGPHPHLDIPRRLRLHSGLDFGSLCCLVFMTMTK